MNLLKKILVSTYHMRDIVIDLNTAMKKIKPKLCYTHFYFSWCSSLKVAFSVCAAPSVLTLESQSECFSSSLPNFDLASLFFSFSGAHSNELLYFHYSDSISMYRIMGDYYTKQLFPFVIEVLSLLILGEQSCLRR